MWQATVRPGNLMLDVSARATKPDERGLQLVYQLPLTELSEGGLAVDSTTVIHWRWKYQEGKPSGSIVLELLAGSHTAYAFTTHKRYDVHGLNMNDPPRQWVDHTFSLRDLHPVYDRFVLGRDPLTQINIAIHQPADQRIEIDTLYIGPSSGQRCDPIPTALTTLPISTGLLGPCTDGILEDFDEDGYLDLILFPTGEPNARGFLGGSSGPLSRGAKTFGIKARSAHHGLPVDIDADGDWDLVLAGSPPRTIEVLENRGAFRFRKRPAPPSQACPCYGVCGTWHWGLERPVFYGRSVRNKWFMGCEEAVWSTMDWQLLPLSHTAPVNDFEEVGSGFFAGAMPDLNNDGYPDLTLCNSQHGVWIVPGTAGGFDSTPIRLVDPQELCRGETEGVVYGDYDADGDLDLYIPLDNPAAYNRLLRNDGAFRFSEVAREAGVGIDLADSVRTESAVWEDFDNDGDLDLYVANFARSSILFLNKGDGTFSEDRNLFPPLHEPVGLVQSGDLDRDGDVDLIAFCDGQPPRPLTNNLDRHNGFAVRVRGNHRHAEALGARVYRVDPRSADRIGPVHEYLTGRGNGSAGLSEIHIGMGDADSVCVEVRYPWGPAVRRVVFRGETGVVDIYAPTESFIEAAATTWTLRWLPKMRWTAWHHRLPVVGAGFLLCLLAGIAFGRISPLPVTLLTRPRSAKSRSSRKQRSKAIVTHALCGVFAVICAVAVWQILDPGAIPLFEWEAWLLFGAPWIGLGFVQWTRAMSRPRAPAGELIDLLLGFGHSSWNKSAVRTSMRLEELRSGDLDEDTAARTAARCHKTMLEDLPGLEPTVSRILILAGDLLPETHPVQMSIKENLDQVSSTLSQIEGPDEILRGTREDGDEHIRPLLEGLRGIRDRLIDLENALKARYATSLSDCMDRQRAHWEGQAHEHGVSFGIQYAELSDGDMDVMAVIEAEPLALCIDNLVQNAIEATSDGRGTQVEIRISTTEKYLKIDVCDDGPGIPEHLRQRVFEAGFSTRGDGRGSGMWMVRTHAGRFGGEVSIERADPGDTCVRLTVRRVARSVLDEVYAMAEV